MANLPPPPAGGPPPLEHAAGPPLPLPPGAPPLLNLTDLQLVAQAQQVHVPVAPQFAIPAAVAVVTVRQPVLHNLDQLNAGLEALERIWSTPDNHVSFDSDAVNKRNEDRGALYDKIVKAERKLNDDKAGYAFITQPGLIEADRQAMPMNFEIDRIQRAERARARAAKGRSKRNKKVKTIKESVNARKRRRGNNSDSSDDSDDDAGDRDYEPGSDLSESDSDEDDVGGAMPGPHEPDFPDADMLAH